MVNIKEDENKNLQSNKIKEEEQTNTFLDNQRQQLENTTSNTISESITNKINDNINEYQTANKAILDKSIDTTNRYQQESINTIQSISNNYIELQNNILNAYQSIFLQFLDDVSKNSNWNNFRFPERYFNIYGKTNQNIIDHAINYTRRLNDFALTSTENFINQ